MLTLNPYLVFKNNCEEAFRFYKEIFHGENLYLGRYKDMPQATRGFFPGSGDEQIMHGTLKINAHTALMGNDNVDTYERVNGAFTNNFFLLISTESKADAYRIFNELARHGEIIMPIAQTFWSSHYGIVTDKFGISWKITFDSDQI